MCEGEISQGPVSLGVRPSDGIKWFCEVALGPALAEAFLMISFLAGPSGST